MTRWIVMVGAGAMGSTIGGGLASKGTKLAVFDRGPAKAATFRAAVPDDILSAWRRLLDAPAIPVTLGDKRDDGAPAFPLTPGVDRRGRAAVDTFLGHPIRLEGARRPIRIRRGSSPNASTTMSRRLKSLLRARLGKVIWNSRTINDGNAP